MAEIIFLGTGTSEGVPRISCLTSKEITCEVCPKAILPGNKNRRRNTSILIRSPNPENENGDCILIDAGKFFYHAAMEWMVRYKIRFIDAVILTHDHFDAIGGLDDMRDFTRLAGKAMPIFLRESDFKTVKQVFSYLVKEPPVSYSPELDLVALTKKSEEMDGKKTRPIPDLKYILISQDLPFVIKGVEFTPLKVLHGGDYICLGYKFGVSQKIAYISDTNLIPDETMEQIMELDLLILDCLFRGDNFSHLSLPQSIEIVKKIRPKKTLFIGMSHGMEHDEVNAELELLRDTDHLDVSLAFDGLRVPVDFMI
eukprot:TRINITY_DN8663_c0_g1_i1.p1 TRINITY_DN8663_c0_g1~~TRINITY_DN8663_c0_g1_i1.p1  ORF type:complete len:312 (+),score=49.28 TRINITY_DN8663_c0_g1_i1:62-997(+)